MAQRRNQLASRWQLDIAYRNSFIRANSHDRMQRLHDVEKYLADNFGTTSSALTFEEYTNGISLTSDDPTFSTAVVILTQTKGMLNLPNNVILLGYVKTDKGDDYLIEHLGNFIIFLKRLGIKHSIQHLAVVFSKEHYDTPTTSKMPK